MAPVGTHHFSQSTSRYTRGRDYRSHNRYDDRSRRDDRYDVCMIFIQRKNEN
jgi:hypothetical protein